MKFNKVHRMVCAALLALALAVCVAVIAPQQLGVILYKLTLVILAGVAGYCLDYLLFPYARPHKLQPAEGCDAGKWKDGFFAAQFRRAIIVAAAMLAVGLGL